MAVISKIRFTNVIYEGGSKRYNDELFIFDGHNAAILLENGGGKTVFIQTALQAVLPHADMAGRKIKETLSLTGTPAHIAIEWIIKEFPRRTYALTAVTLFMNNNDLDSFRYVHEYEEGSPHSIENLPFAKEGVQGKKRPADKGEMQEYYAYMSSQSMNAHSFGTIKEYQAYLEDTFHIIPSEWRNIAVINGAEGGVEIFFDECKTTNQLVSQLLIPTVEEAINGNDGKAFAEIFEKQREQFKQSKQLRMQIQESKLLENQIQQYSQLYAHYHEARSLLDREKEWAKALFYHARNEQENIAEELHELEKQLTETAEEIRIIKRKKASREIAVQEHALQKWFMDWRREKQGVEENQRVYEDLELQQHTLEYAKYKARKLEAEEKIELIEYQLAQLDEEQDSTQVSDNIDRTKREICGYFEKTEKALKQDEMYVTNRLESVLSQKKTKQAEMEQERRQIAEKQKAQAVNQHQIEQTTGQMERIANKILDNPLQEHVEAFIPVWKEEMSKTQANQQIYQQHCNECKEHKEIMAQKLEETRLALQEAQQKTSHWNMKCEEVERQQEMVLAEVKLLFPRLAYLDTMYAKQETVKQTIADKVALLEREKEEAMLKERRVARMSDEYTGISSFFADPDLSLLVARWKDAFGYLEAGADFIQSIVGQREISLDTLYARFPYWAATLITTEQEIEQLVQRAKKHADQLRTPIFVVSLQEARVWLESAQEYPYTYREIIPSHWRINLDQDQFERWKRDIRKKADEVVQLRKSKEKEYQQILQLNHQVLSFYATYPQAIYTEWKKQRDESHLKENDLQKEIVHVAERIRKYEQEWASYKDKLANEMGREQHLGYRLHEANDYLQQKKEREAATKKGNELSGEIVLLERSFTALVKLLEELEKQVEELRSEREEKKQALTHVQGDRLYQHVKDSAPLAPRHSIERLREELDVLEGLLRKQQAGRADLERQLERLRKEIRDSENEMGLVQAKASQSLDQEALFPVDGHTQLQRLVEKLTILKKELSRQRTIEERLNNEVAAHNSRLALMKKNFLEKDFVDEAIDSFEGNLDEALTLLEQEEKSATSRTNYLRNQEKLGRQTAKELDEISRELEIRNGTYQFLTPVVQNVALLEEDLLAFPYKRSVVIQKRIGELERKQALEERENKKVQSEKERFKRFCESKIHNIKLRDTAIAGIENKLNYTEVEEWATSMSRTIATSIRVLEDNLQGRDKELQDFITIVHTHLQRIAIELKIIPKKTSVKIDNGWKEVYNFHVPEWKEEIGKQLLRQHVDWMLQRLDGGDFKDQEGKEDMGKIKKFIFTSLQSKSLLGIVMGSDSIRVKCRKVSKDGKVSGVLSAWEESNKWSGGEKWSKNMTLFLGILNYLAEKRQHLVQNGKRYRTVIVDNPFGKASSEHVLDPVFFIADQLGFQLIALTAHAEGKFIRDYFPIVYSCRLRESTGGDVLIMTKEREIRQAYFRDHDPNVLLRLSEHEQLSLFT